MRIPLQTKYRTLAVYFNIHASISLQFKAYSPMFTNKLLSPAILSYVKARYKEIHRAIHNSISQPSLESLIVRLS